MLIIHWDVVVPLGRQMLSDYLPRLKKKYHPQLTIVNGENAAAGRNYGKIYKKFLQDGVDVVTMGEPYVGQQSDF